MLTGYQLSGVTLLAFTLVTITAYVQLGPRFGYRQAFQADTEPDEEPVQPVDD
jgi:hypothetical protein